MGNLIKIILLLAVAGFIVLSVNQIASKNEAIEIKSIELKNVSSELETVNEELEKAKETSSTRIDQLMSEKQKLEDDKRELEKKLEAKAEEKKGLAETASKVINTITNTQTAYALEGDKYTWMGQAGIAESDWEYVDFIVQKESSWNPEAVNKSSGACSLVQALPCSKIGNDWRNPVTALKWQKKYVENRYGGYKQAYDFWQKNHWY